MPAGVTYEPIATTALSGFTTATYSSLGSYTDIKIVASGIGSTSSSYFCLRFNGDTGSNYSRTMLSGDGSAASSSRATNDTSIFLHNASTLQTQPGLVIVDVFSYGGSTNKTILSQAAQDKNGSGSVERIVGLWRNTAAVTSITIFTPGGTISSGQITLYGIKNSA
jgi:hypothetical protein